jgi:glycyl-tRNA synthetase beta chain
MTYLLLELYTEEIPAMMQQNAEHGYTEIFRKYLQESNITYSKLETFIGPRRITVHIEGIDPVIGSKVVELKGPKINAPDAAILGFCGSNNITKNDLTIKTIKGQECYVYEVCIQEQKVSDILPNILSAAISEYTWPKSMFWGAYDTKYVRPLKNILCLFDDKVLPFTHKHLRANNKTFGHRFMSCVEVEVNNFEEYKAALLKHMVILSRKERSEMIISALRKLTTSDLVLSDDTKLLEEVVGLVEYPNVFIGQIPEKFMHIPSEVLITAMRKNQRYFTLQNADGSFAPYFLFVSNIKTDSPHEIVEGNAKVLYARLADAAYFYAQDQKTSLEKRTSQLERIIFHAKLGSMKAKVERIEHIAKWLEPNNHELHIAARLCKSDLVTEVVVEFPELQGIMGGYYAKLDGMSDEVASAIKHHYKPEGADDKVPEGSAALLALADKVDSLVSLYIAGERSSGSKDPYALRRYALSIIRIILSTEIRIHLKELIDYASSLHKQGTESIVAEILLFIEDRLKHDLRKSYSHGLVTATISLEEESDIVTATNKLEAIQKFLSTKEGEDLLTCYARASNILSQDDMNSVIMENSIQENQNVPQQRLLSEHLQSISPQIDQMLQSKDFTGALGLLTTLLSPINQFFDNVIVMDADRDVTNSRLALLRAVTQEFHKLAKFSEI